MFLRKLFVITGILLFDFELLVVDEVKNKKLITLSSYQLLSKYSKLLTTF